MCVCTYKEKGGRWRGGIRDWRYFQSSESLMLTAFFSDGNFFPSNVASPCFYLPCKFHLVICGTLSLYFQAFKLNFKIYVYISVVYFVHLKKSLFQFTKFFVFFFLLKPCTLLSLSMLVFLLVTFTKACLVSSSLCLFLKFNLFNIQYIIILYSQSHNANM